MALRKKYRIKIGTWKLRAQRWANDKLNARTAVLGIGELPKLPDQASSTPSEDATRMTH